MLCLHVCNHVIIPGEIHTNMSHTVPVQSVVQLVVQLAVRGQVIDCPACGVRAARGIAWHGARIIAVSQCMIND